MKTKQVNFRLTPEFIAEIESSKQDYQAITKLEIATATFIRFLVEKGLNAFYDEQNELEMQRVEYKNLLEETK